MEIGDNWKLIQRVFSESKISSRHFAVATVNQDGTPNVAPIGALFLRDDKTGFFFDEYTVNTSKNIDRNSRVCILASISNAAFWQKALVMGEFEIPPAVRLMGSAGKKREGTEEEIAMWYDHIKEAKGTKGYDLMWENIQTVRDIYFDFFEPVRAGEMTQDLWK